MSLVAEIANAVRGRFATEVATPESLPVVYDNVPTDQHPSGTRWCRLHVQLGICEQVAAGGPGRRRFRTTGVALVQLFEPVGGGDGMQLGIVGVVQDAFRNVSIPGPPYVTFQSPYVSAPPAREDSWWLVPVTIPFYADEDA